MCEKNYTAGIYTLGCKVNQYESEAIAEKFRENGIEVLPPSCVCDIYVINTCTVTSESDRKARQFIRRAISRNPFAYILVTGCLAQTSPESLCAISGVDFVCGNSSKLSVVDEALRLISEGSKPAGAITDVGNIDTSGFEKMNITEFDRTRAYLKIEDGCENKCTYCIIPHARGKVRSKPKEDVLSEIKELTLGGCREIVLTGIETASYGRDLANTDLASLLCEVDAVPGIGRVRLGSLDPSLITPGFVNRISSLHSLAPHFHLSLQSGSDRVLALMKRKYNSAMASNAINLLRADIPDVKFTTDVIVGFPGETDDDFMKTVEFAEKAGFLRIHIFTYSKRKGTPAASMPDQIPENIKNERLHYLGETEARIRERILKSEIVRKPEREVLFESYERESGYAYGHTSDFIEVCVPSERPMHSELHTVRLYDTDGELCFADLTEK